MHKVTLFYTSGMDMGRLLARFEQYSNRFAFSLKELDGKILAQAYDAGALGFNVDVVRNCLVEHGVLGGAELHIFLFDKRLASRFFAVYHEIRLAIISIFGLGNGQKENSDRVTASYIVGAAMELLDRGRYSGFVDSLYARGYEALDTVEHADRKDLMGIRFGEVGNTQVLITHGIRTHAYWCEPVQQELKKRFGMDSDVHRYGLVDTFSFLFSESLQYKLAVKLLAKLVRMQRDAEQMSLAVVAHSYGSLLLIKAIEIAEDLDIDLDISCVVLNGAVIKESFAWERFMDKRRQSCIRIGRILNICGDSDIWPAVASKLAPNAGAAGVLYLGQNSSKVKNLRLKDCGHSDMLSSEICRNYWGKYIESGTYQDTESADIRPWVLFIYRYFWFIVFSLVALGGYSVWYVVSKFIF